MTQASATTKSPPTTTPARRMTLDTVTKGRTEKPRRLLVYGTPGVGKSTFACSAPGVVVLPGEDGTAHLDVARFPMPETWRDVLDATQVLLSGEHSYETLVIDTLDGIEPLIFAEVCREAGKRGGGGGFGKGYTAVLDKWREPSPARAVQGDMRLATFVAHATIRRFQNLRARATTATSQAQDKAAGLIISGRTTSSSPSTGLTTRLDGRRRSLDKRAFSTRKGAPPGTPRTGATSGDHSSTGRATSSWPVEAPATAEQLRRDIAVALETAPVPVATKVRAWLTTTGDDAAELARGLDRLRARLMTAE